MINVNLNFKQVIEILNSLYQQPLRDTTLSICEVMLKSEIF